MEFQSKGATALWILNCAFSHFQWPSHEETLLYHTIEAINCISRMVNFVFFWQFMRDPNTCSTYFTISAENVLGWWTKVGKMWLTVSLLSDTNFLPLLLFSCQVVLIDLIKTSWKNQNYWIWTSIFGIYEPLIHIYKHCKCVW